MNIRAKLTVTFFLIVIVVLSVISVSIYFLSQNYREADFYRRLQNRAINTAKLLVEVEEINADLLRRIEQNNPASLPNQHIIIFNDRNEEIYSSVSNKPFTTDSALLSKIRREEETRYVENNFEIIGFVFRHKAEDFTVVAGATDFYGLDAIHNLRSVLLAIMSVSVLIVSVLGWFYAGRVLRPISKIVEEVGAISETNLNRRLDEGNNRDELSRLARTFNGMLHRLQNAFALQKNFIANASHEIKTPITILAGEVNVTLLQKRENEYYVNVLKSVLKGLRNLNTLSSQLLLLAQTNSEQPSGNFTKLRIDDILWEAKDEILKMHNQCAVDILLDINLNHASLVIYGDEQLLKIAILNLMDNGCKYSDNNQVSITLRNAGQNMLAIDFVNRGKGIDKEKLDKIFSPFYRANDDKTVKGFGIGLSLADRIVKLHAGTITVQSVPNQHTSFSITLPTTNESIL